MNRDQIYEVVQSLLSDHDLFAASDFVIGLGDALTVAQAFAHLIVDAHHKAHSTEQVLHFGHAGVHYCLSHAAACESSVSDTAKQLRYAAKRMATNVASFTWPGWVVEGVTITPEQAKQGLMFARYSVRQLHALDPTDAKLAFTYWFLGAQLLADRQLEEARRVFGQALVHAEAQGDNPDGVLMLRGYIALTDVLAANAEAARSRFDASLAALRARDNDDATFYAQQLATARQVFVHF